MLSISLLYCYRSSRLNSLGHSKRAYSLHTLPKELKYLQAPNKELIEGSKKLEKATILVDEDGDKTAKKIRQEVRFDRPFPPSSGGQGSSPANDYALRISGYEE